jgi:hypothetical protein
MRPGAITLLPRPPWGAAGGTLETGMGLGRALFLHLEARCYGQVLRAGRSAAGAKTGSYLLAPLAHQPKQTSLRTKHKSCEPMLGISE